MERYVYCPYCDSRVIPGQDVVHVDDEDPWRELWHKHCREIWQHDKELAAEMSKAKP